MTILGNILLGLAALIYVLPLQMVLHDQTPRRNEGSAIWAAILILGPLWILLTAATCAATAKGGLDWSGRERSLQYLLVVAAGVSLLVATIFCFNGKFDPPSGAPAFVRMLATAAVEIFPLVVLVFGALALNPGLAQSLLVRVPLLAVSGVSLVLTAGLAIMLFASMQKNAVARGEAQVEFHNKRDRDMLARAELLTAEEGFVELLGFANRFEKEQIRAIAIQKIQAHPQLSAALSRILTSGFAEQALIYLDACDAPDPQALAEPVRVAILTLAANARESVEKTHTFYAAQFDWNTRLILSVADKFAGRGVDYAPAIREFRAALELPRAKDFGFTARRPLDAWLAKHGGR